jgi:hypothetical protein
MTGIDWQGPARQPCPACNKGPRDRALSVTRNPDGSAVAHCFRCEYAETTRGETRPGKAPIRPAAATKRETLSDYGRDLWRTCRPVSGAGLAYLQARGCVVPPADGDLRYHPALKHPVTGYTGPALVGLVTDAADGRAWRTLHRTWVRADGTKAPEADPPRMLLGGHRKAGAVCRLWPDDCVNVGLGIGEGIETALSLAHGAAPVWAAIDAGNLADFPVLAGIECLTIAADRDPAGIKAARECATRWRAAGRRVRVVLPDADGADLNDEAHRA